MAVNGRFPRPTEVPCTAGRSNNGFLAVVAEDEATCRDADATGASAGVDATGEGEGEDGEELEIYDDADSIEVEDDKVDVAVEDFSSRLR